MRGSDCTVTGVAWERPVNPQQASVWASALWELRRNSIMWPRLILPVQDQPEPHSETLSEKTQTKAMMLPSRY